ncbi:unnamed protein product [Fusarium fujikuroi]|nr:unnamed protein product [Fusarium fujikuroi]
MQLSLKFFNKVIINYINSNYIKYIFYPICSLIFLTLSRKERLFSIITPIYLLIRKFKTGSIFRQKEEKSFLLTGLYIVLTLALLKTSKKSLRRGYIKYILKLLLI